VVAILPVVRDTDPPPFKEKAKFVDARKSVKKETSLQYLPYIRSAFEDAFALAVCSYIAGA
jgi:hypothetical protein